MNGVIEVLAVLGLAAAAVLLVSRFPDTRKGLGEELDDALFKSGVRGLWLLVGLAAIALLAVWLLR